MSASLLYRTNQIENVQVKNTKYFPDKLVIEVVYTPQEPLCPCCCHDKCSLKGVKTGTIENVPKLSNRLVQLIFLSKKLPIVRLTRFLEPSDISNVTPQQWAISLSPLTWFL